MKMLSLSLFFTKTIIYVLSYKPVGFLLYYFIFAVGLTYTLQCQTLVLEIKLLVVTLV